MSFSRNSKFSKSLNKVQGKLSKVILEELIGTAAYISLALLVLCVVTEATVHRCFFEIGVLKNFEIFTGKRQWWSLSL